MMKELFESLENKWNKNFIAEILDNGLRMWYTYNRLQERGEITMNNKISWIVGRRINGITINDLEWVLDE
jgi:hypothetical protein